MISIKKWFKKLFDNYISSIINHDFHVITLWMHYVLFISVFRRNKINCYCWLNFPCVRFFEIIYDKFHVWFNFIKVFFDLQGFISITITSLFNIIVAIKITYSFWFIIIFLLFKKTFSISNYSVSWFFFFWSSIDMLIGLKKALLFIY